LGKPEYVLKISSMGLDDRHFMLLKNSGDATSTISSERPGLKSYVLAGSAIVEKHFIEPSRINE
jgi:hypothetical protein